MTILLMFDIPDFVNILKAINSNLIQGGLFEKIMMAFTIRHKRRLDKIFT